MIRNFVMFAALIAAMPESGSAQLMGARELNAGVAVKGSPSNKPVADVYYFAGEAGAKETYTLVAKGEASITLFGPDGSELLTSSGSATVKLEAILPFTDVFTVAIARKTSAQSYTRSRKTTVPTFVEANMATGVGYESKDGTFSQCWLVPGVKLRATDPEKTIDYTLAADRKSMTYYVKFVNRQIGGGEVSLSYDGTQVRDVAHSLDGQILEDHYPLKVAFDPQTKGRYLGYLCKN